MAGKPGRSGTNKNKDKPWTDALRLAVNETGPNKEKKLRALARACVDAAIAGDVQAMREIGDRLDGKPQQSVDIQHDASETFVRLLEAISSSDAPALADGVAGEQEQPPPIRH
jgi:hypothetical protein